MSSTNVKSTEFESENEVNVAKFRDELKSENIAGEIDLDDELLVKFLRSRFYDVEKSCKLLQTYCSLFHKYPQFFKSVDYAKKGFESGVCKVLNERGTNGETIVLFDISAWDTSNVTAHQIISSMVCALEFAAFDERTQLNGCICIVNMQSLSFKHISKLGISELQLSVLIMDHSLPIKWQKMIVINENSFTNIIFKIGRPFLSKELKERLEFPGKDLSPLQKFVCLDYLPPHFGGTAKHIQCIDFDTVKSGEEKLLKLWQSFKVNE